MREVNVQELAETLQACIRRASFELGPREAAALRAARARETSASGCAILNDLAANQAVAAADRRPLCQDTGVAVVLIEIGQEVRLTGGDLYTALQQAVGTAYQENFLRPSMVRHPLERVNTGNNTPAIIHTRIVAGDRVRMRFAAKGGGCENMSRLAMLTPSAGRAGVVDFVVQTVKAAGGNACPPVIVGVGLGGNFEWAALLAKEALLRPLGDPAPDPADAELERELLEKINATGVGPMGLGGAVTALAVHVAAHPCHIASLPVAVNLDCHSHRHAEGVV